MSILFITGSNLAPFAVVEHVGVYCVVKYYDNDGRLVGTSRVYPNRPPELARFNSANCALLYPRSKIDGWLTNFIERGLSPFDEVDQLHKLAENVARKAIPIFWPH